MPTEPKLLSDERLAALHQQLYDLSAEVGGSFPLGDVEILLSHIDALAARVKELEEERDLLVEKVEREESAHLSTIDERDAAHDAADHLAYGIAHLVDPAKPPTEVVGEHSNLNCPWDRAQEFLGELESQLQQLRDSPQVPAGAVLFVPDGKGSYEKTRNGRIRLMLAGVPESGGQRYRRIDFTDGPAPLPPSDKT